MISRKQQGSMSLGKFRLKIFLYTGVAFGIFMGLYHAISYGLVESVVFGLVSGSLFGLIMAFTLGFLQRHAAKTYGWAEGEVPAVNQRRDVDVALAPDAAFELAQWAVAALPAKVITRDTSTWSIQATTGRTWQSWGERLSVHVEPRPAGSVVRIGSRPRFPLTAADYGKNRANVESIANRLQVV
jgi:hypothetical protein